MAVLAKMQLQGRFMPAAATKGGQQYGSHSIQLISPSNSTLLYRKKKKRQRKRKKNYSEEIDPRFHRTILEFSFGSYVRFDVLRVVYRRVYHDGKLPLTNQGDDHNHRAVRASGAGTRPLGYRLAIEGKFAQQACTSTQPDSANYTKCPHVPGGGLSACTAGPVPLSAASEATICHFLLTTPARISEIACGPAHTPRIIGSSFVQFSSQWAH